MISGPTLWISKTKNYTIIMVEGETEQIYFSQLRADYPKSNLSIEPKISPCKDPWNIVEREN